MNTFSQINVQINHVCFRTVIVEGLERHEGEKDMVKKK